MWFHLGCPNFHQHGPNLLPHLSQLGTNLAVIFTGLCSTNVSAIQPLVVITQSAFHKVFEWAPVTRPVGVLDPAPPKGCSCVGPETKSFRNVTKLQGHPGRVTGGPVSIFCCNLDQLWLYLGPSWPSCRSCSSILSNLAPTWLQLGPSLLQLGST